MVKRYKFTSSEFSSFVLEDDGGDLVLFTDYESLQRERDGLREALQLCYDHCRLYHPDIEGNNVGEVVRAALAKGASQ